MEIMETILPVLMMMGVGMLCRKMKLLNQSGIDNLKILVTKVILPVAIFHALGTAIYSMETVKMVAVMFGMLVISFALGYACKPLVKGKYQKYLPFMVSVYEGGMMAYPLFTNLCGSENLSRIVILDIAGLLFGFSIYMGLLEQTEEGGMVNLKKLAASAIKNPVFIATLIGLALGISGMLQCLLQSGYGTVYLSVESMITTPLSALILLIVGYELKPDLKIARTCAQTIVLRVLVQTVMVAGVLMVLHILMGKDFIRDIAIVIYMSAPATFSLQTFVKDREGSAYVATTNSLYCLVTIAVYVMEAVIIQL